MVITISDECGEITLEQIKWLESRCRKERKRLESNGGDKCNRTIDKFSNENGMFEQENLGENK